MSVLIAAKPPVLFGSCCGPTKLPDQTARCCACQGFPVKVGDLGDFFAVRSEFRFHGDVFVRAIRKVTNSAVKVGRPGKPWPSWCAGMNTS